MTLNQPIEPPKRIEILDILRGFALLGIIFMNMSVFNGYIYIPFEDLKQATNFALDEKLYAFLEIAVAGKFYTLFSMLFAVGFYIQLSKHTGDSIDFLKTYRRRLGILFVLGLIHSLIWFGDILLTYSIYGFILILFRNVQSKNLIRLSLFFILVPFLIDLAVLPFSEALSNLAPESSTAIAHVEYPDMPNEELINTFQNGSIGDLIVLNIHNAVWKYLGYLPSGKHFTFLGIFLLGYYLASTGFFTKQSKSTVALLGTFLIGLLATISAKLIGGSYYQFPPTPTDILFKFLSITGQLFMCLSYIISIFKIVQSTKGRKALAYLIPVGRMALSNYLLQTLLMITIFYNFGFNLFGKISLMQTTGIVILILVSPVILSNLWLKHFRFGPMEWIWRSLTYQKRISMRYQKEKLN